MVLLDADVLIDILRQYPKAVKWARSDRGQEAALP